MTYMIFEPSDLCFIGFMFSLIIILHIILFIVETSSFNNIMLTGVSTICRMIADHCLMIVTEDDMI